MPCAPGERDRVSRTRQSPGCDQGVASGRRTGEALDAERRADVVSALAITQFMAGRSDEALNGLAAALQGVTGVTAARIRVRHGYLLGMLGRPTEAARELRTAARTLRRAGDFVWETRAELNLAQSFIETGDTGRADIALRRAEHLLQDSSHTFEAAVARQDRGFVAALEGRIPDALRHYDIAEARYRAAGAPPVELAESRAAVLVAAGLFREALVQAESAVAQLREARALAGAPRSCIGPGQCCGARGRRRCPGSLVGSRGRSAVRSPRARPRAHHCPARIGAGTACKRRTGPTSAA